MIDECLVKEVKYSTQEGEIIFRRGPEILEPPRRAFSMPWEFLSSDFKRIFLPSTEHLPCPFLIIHECTQSPAELSILVVATLQAQSDTSSDYPMVCYSGHSFHLAFLLAEGYPERCPKQRPHQDLSGDQRLTSRVTF